MTQETHSRTIESHSREQDIQEFEAVYGKAIGPIYSIPISDHQLTTRSMIIRILGQDDYVYFT
jgi:hypothetical protein